jgi:Xaa-Pro aminopeptidase
LVDPRKFKTDEEYAYAQKVAWAKGQFVTEFLEWMDSKVTESQFLTEKEQGKVIDKVRMSTQ